jgi:cyclic beta-1,2-glucan synthetase
MLDRRGEDAGPGHGHTLNGWLLPARPPLLGTLGFTKRVAPMGFLDQLQDASLAVKEARAHPGAPPDSRRGRVQHWWFPSAGQGVRTRISTIAWLATVAAHYVETTGDASILDERGVPRRPGAARRA